jgi:3-hydroxyisobutyrate dehydrogenase-like beta-hydroxyacid dehydrogenase
MTTLEHTATAVGFIGLGAMGQPMTSHLSQAGVQVVGYDINSDAVQRFTAHGGTPARDIPEVMRQASVVITSLPTFSAVRDVVDVLADTHRSGSGDGTVVIESSTLSLDQKKAVQATATAAGIEIFDCPISGTSAQAINGDLVAYLSGPQNDSLDVVRDVMSAVCRATYWTGEFGNGTRMKLVANLLVSIHNVATAEALLLARRAGLDLDLVIESVGDGAGSSRMLQVRGPLMARGEVEHATARVDLFQKDIAAIRLLAEELGSPTPLLDASSKIYDLAADDGRAGQDAAAVYCILDELQRSS